MTNHNARLHVIIQAAINSAWELKKNDGFWNITEPQAKHDLLQIRCGHGFAFSLDHPDKPYQPFPFLGSNLSGLCAVADGILVTEQAGIDYIIIIEMKSSDSGTHKAIQQIHASKRLMVWLCDSLHYYKHWSGDLNFIGVVSLLPRRHAVKQTTSRAAGAAIPKPVRHGDIAVFHLDNHPVLDVKRMLETLS